MKQILIGIFAHPDDEAFGPSGTLLKLKDEGYDIHLILLTPGDAGMNVDNVPDLAATRLEEWKSSAEILGARSMTALDYRDGTLDNIPEDELDIAVKPLVEKIISDYSEPFELSFITLEPHGLTGHRDHISASQLATRIATMFTTKAIWYFCLDSSQAPLDGTAYYEPRAREDSYVTTRIDVTPRLERKYQMIDAHYSQRQDAEVMKKLGAKTECFHVDTF